MIRKDQFILSGSGDRLMTGDLTADQELTGRGAVLFVHGFKGFKDWGAHNLVAAKFAEQGFRYFKINLSHSGVRQDNPNEVTDLDAFAANTIGKELQDLDTAVNYVSHTYPFEPIYVIGHSRGGGLVILKGAADKRISSIVTWASIADFSSLWKKEQEEDWKKSGRIFVENARTKEQMPLDSVLLEDFEAHREEYNILQAASRVNVPWLILHGDEDINVPFSIAQQLAQAQPKATIQKISGANHVFGASQPYADQHLPDHLAQVVEKTLSFLLEQSSSRK